MASEIIEYRGYELHVEPYESGLKACIIKSGSLFNRPELPYSENKTQREQMIAEAKGIVDTLLDGLIRRSKSTNGAGIARRECLRSPYSSFLRLSASFPSATGS